MLEFGVRIQSCESFIKYKVQGSATLKKFGVRINQWTKRRKVGGQKVAASDGRRLCINKIYTVVSSERCKEYSLLDRNSRIARECSTYNLFNSRHLKTCIAEALKIGELQRSNNAFDGSTSKDLVKQHTNTWEYF